ncbi:MAG: O-methyltransferase [Trueperaceae bacterium]
MFIPSLVEKALELAEQNNFQNSCLPEVGQLLRLLVASAKPGKIAELGTGCGVSSAWIVSGLQPEHHLLSVDNNALLHEAVTQLFVGETRATFLLGDWHSVLGQGPFQFIFIDIAEAKDDSFNTVIDAVVSGGFILLDDFTPLHLREEKTDARREQWLNDPRLVAVELLTTPTSSVILATKT